MSNQNDLAEVQKHNRVLLHALQTGHPVMREGRKAFLKGIYFQTDGGGILVRVYLAGEPHRTFEPSEITLATNHHSMDLT